MILYDALFKVAFIVLFSYLVICFGDKVLGHLDSLCLVHIVAYSETSSWVDILKSCFR